MSLIHRLNQMATLTPDEIAKKLSGNNGWIKGSEFTQAQVDAAQGERWRVRSPRGTDLDHYNFDWAFNYLTTSLSNHWFKPNADFGGDDDKPDITA